MHLPNSTLLQAGCSLFCYVVVCGNIPSQTLWCSESNNKLPLPQIIIGKNVKSASGSCYVDRWAPTFASRSHDTYPCLDDLCHLRKIRPLTLSHSQFIGATSVYFEIPFLQLPEIFECWIPPTAFGPHPTGLSLDACNHTVLLHHCKSKVKLSGSPTPFHFRPASAGAGQLTSKVEPPLQL
jgi:hypothetical protein